MAGHVNMMDDVLISNLPPNLLRSSLRTLVSQGATTQRPFVEHIRKRFLESPPAFPPYDILFSEVLFADSATKAREDYLAVTRCMFSCKLAQESLPYLTHFVQALLGGKAIWLPGEDLAKTLDKFSGDVVQAVQALKESRPALTPELRQSLRDLLSSFERCASYIGTDFPLGPMQYPFTRAERQVRDVFRILFPEDASAVARPDEEADAKQLPLDISAPAADVQTISLGPHQVPRLFNGLWQLSSPAWGSASSDEQQKALSELVTSGLTAADMADHYGDAELIYGEFRNRLPAEIGAQVYAATKWCVFGPISEPITREFVTEAVEERCRRLGGRVELLQFHWHDYSSKMYLEILAHLVEITKTRPDLVSTIGLCNFDSEHVEEACSYLLEQTGSVGLVSNQVQFSLFDARPLQKMTVVCEKYGMKLLTYGSFCGGFISPKWLGQPIPDIYSEAAQLTPSQRKYLDMILTWGTWSDFQSLLTTLSSIAKKYNATLTNVATRWVLQLPSVGAIIVGTRLGVSSHVEDNLHVFKFKLSDEDLAAISAAALGPSGERAAAVFKKLGDCGNEYRAMP